MKKKMKAAVFFLLIFTLVFGGNFPVDAASPLPKIPKTFHVWYYPKGNSFNIAGNGMYDRTVPYAKLSNVKYSKGKVAKLHLSKSGMLSVEALGEGVTKVSFQLSSGKKKKSYKTTIRVTTYANLFKTFKIGTLDLKSAVNKYFFPDPIKKDVSGKVAVTAASGWKVVKMRRTVYDYAKDKTIRKTVKNGSKQSFEFRPKNKNLGSHRFYVTMKHKKSGKTIDVIIQFGNRGVQDTDL